MEQPVAPFNDWLQAAPETARFSMPGWYVWCGCLTRDADGLYYLFFARWPQHMGFEAWVTHSEIAYATSPSLFGTFTFQGVTLPYRRDEVWDQVSHNPTIIHWRGKYYLYYMGTHGPVVQHSAEAEPSSDLWWRYRNNQRIGVAVADTPAGPWIRAAQPVVETSSTSWDALVTSNPSCCETPDGAILMMYKGVGLGPLPKGGDVVAGIATAKHPLGPFYKQPEPAIAHPMESWAVEDPFIWYQSGTYYCLIKDFHGYFTHDQRGSVALLQSSDGINWQPAQPALAFRREIRWQDGQSQSVERIERPQIWFEDGMPRVLICAVREAADSQPYSLRIPLLMPT
ncbi:glycoside hydrolase family protein [Dictyobacter aurantiacus]|uniref:Sucrase n=1 Tax=Dictyobacter aurantiacus TaxID=1936993 RepID=A0A401ZRA1_9CHLR|nr:glycoside hydrolase family protein [Dictyobacter aurantiacus]GCE09405.1 sucrase [Dictyobacter aurantiacus]